MVSILCGLALLLISGASLAGEPGFSGLILTNDAKVRKDTGAFDCKSRIHVLVEGVKGRGRHVLDADWIGPAGKRLHHSRQEFKVRKSSVDAWVWLELPHGSGTKVLSSRGTSAGMGRFIGWWTVKVYLDGEQIGDKGFVVACQGP